MGCLKITYRNEFEHLKVSFRKELSLKNSAKKGYGLYELKNHLGNVLVTISDRKILEDVNGNNVIDAEDHYISDVISYADYYAFGMVMPGRNGNSSEMRYGYQGSEKDNEIKGNNNSYTTHFRQLDPRLGRWLSIDPKATAHESPYVSMGNNPVWYNDVLGDKYTDPAKKEVKKYRKELKKIDKELGRLIKEWNPSQRTSKAEFQTRRKEISNIKKELTSLKKSSQLYNVKFDASIGGSGKSAFNPNTGAIDVIIGSDAGSDFSSYVGTLGHELKHAYQFEKGLISFNYVGDKDMKVGNIPENLRNGGGLIYDVEDERAAWHRDALIEDVQYNKDELNQSVNNYYKSTFMIKTARNINTIMENSNMSYGDYIIKELKRFKAGKTDNIEVIKGWEKFAK